MKLTLYRLRENKFGTFGVLCTDEKAICPTLERTWQGNQKEISCIPAGNYKCSRHKSSHFGECFIVLEVPGRSDILFHAGNWQTDSKGCIVLGMSFDIVTNQEGLSGGGNGFRRFMETLKGINDFDLVITRV